MSSGSQCVGVSSSVVRYIGAQQPYCVGATKGLDSVTPHLDSGGGFSFNSMFFVKTFRAQKSMKLKLFLVKGDGGSSYK